MDLSLFSMLVSAVLILTCLFLIINPFFKNEKRDIDPELDLSIHENKMSLMTTLNEIEFEHKMNKISDEDYSKLKKQYESLIADLLKNEIHATKQEINLDVMNQVEAEIEKELQKRRESKGE